MPFNEVHLGVLVGIIAANGHNFNYGGGNPIKDLLEPIRSAANVLSGGDANFDFGFGDAPLTKEAVKGICNDPKSSNQKCYIAICAWGKIRLGNFVNSLRHWRRIDEIITGLRFNNDSPFDAYNIFNEPEITGLGPAFFTKVIYFLTCNRENAENKGFIMDQYTAKSMNLLKQGVKGSQALKFTSDMLARSNTGEQYQAYCAAIIELANTLNCKPEITKKINCTPEIAEEIIFSGRNQPWRMHINANHQN